MRRCILHVGSPKTGTTSIQHVLGKNREEFARHGIHVPASGQNKAGTHRILARALLGFELKPEEQSILQDFTQEMAASKLDTMLLSSEQLYGILNEDVLARRMLSRLRTMGFEITILLYARNQPQFLNSWYTQHAKSLRISMAFQRYVNKNLANLEKLQFSRWLDFRDRYNVNLIVRPFTGEVRNGLIADFLGAVGVLGTDTFEQSVVLNESTGPFAIALARRLLRKISDDKPMSVIQANRCARMLREAVAAEGVKEPSYCGLSTETAARIQSACTPANDRVALAVWGRQWADVFSTDIERDFEPNDYAIVGIPPNRRVSLNALFRELLPRFRRIKSNPAIGTEAGWNKVSNWRAHVDRSSAEDTTPIRNTEAAVSASSA